ncbi:Hypothetical protein CINCED_3A019176 [Cinara cedri]|uniref:Uncharacterized protein n=1 Tax=Cinara cedri TaxID=506608 RepID=A0A5E4MRQ5_9HEMI|nr:Hypothetical protein CINCED_3A019176 [Cinara cedri]
MRFAKSLLILTLAVTVSHVSPRMINYTSSFTSLEFLHHVAEHEYEWRNVLKEHVINLGAVPYHNRILGVINPGETNPRVILYRILYNFSNIGSYVEYAASALYKSLACYSIKHLAFQSHYLSRMFDKKADPGVIQIELDRIKLTTTLILDKLCIRPADLTNLFEFYWEAIRLIQYDINHHARYQVYPTNSQSYVDILHIRIKDFLKHHCAKYLLDGHFLYDMEMKINYLLMDEVLNLIVDIPELKRLGQEHENFVTAYYKNLAFEMLPKLQWGQVFYYTKPSIALEKLRETNPPITYPPTAVDSPTNVEQAVIGNKPTSGSIMIM